MPNITRSQFNATLKNGVDLKNEKLQGKLQEAGVSAADLAKADANKDGFLTGSEVGKAFSFVDGFDRNGSGESFADAGKAGAVFGALQAGKFDGGQFGIAISKAATARAKADPQGYAVPNAPTSPLKNLSGNKVPGQSRPSWLKNQNKCNQFVGDSLTQAGVKAPTHKMKDGSVHYVQAELWPQFTALFDRVTDPAKIRPGDVFVVDYPGTGESSGHTEVITGNNPLRSTGAHHDGAYEMDRSTFLDNATFDPAGKCFVRPDGVKIYFLRPKAAL